MKEITIEQLEKLIQDPIPEASEFYYPECWYYSEHNAYYEWRNSAFREIISLLKK